MRLSVYCTDKQTLHATGWHFFYRLGVQISVRLTSFCGRKKKTANQFQDQSFRESLLGKKLLIKTEKVNYFLQRVVSVQASAIWSVVKPGNMATIH